MSPVKIVSRMTFALAIETSGDRGSVALGRDGAVMAARTFESIRRHGADLMPNIADLCRECDVRPEQIGLVCLSIGPGSFTGLRLGVAVARALSLSIGAAIVPVPTLQVIVHNALDLPHPPERLAVFLDAKRNRAYAAAFTLRDQSYEATTDTLEVDPAEFLRSQPSNIIVTGEGVRAHHAAIESVGCAMLAENLRPARAEWVLKLGHRIFTTQGPTSRRDVVPLYVRLPEPEEKLASRATIRQ